MNAKHLKFQRMLEDLEVVYIYDDHEDQLGKITYCQQWKCWVFESRRPQSDLASVIIWSADCLQKVVEQIAELNKDYPEGIPE